MNCEKSRENISAYFDNELSEVEIFELKEHINDTTSINIRKILETMLIILCLGLLDRFK